jgi:phenylalanyl-tRNA synthetase alpha chain
MTEDIRRIQEEALREIALKAAGANAADALSDLRVKYLGRKGAVTELFKKMSQVAPEDRAQTGSLLNILKNSVQKAIDDSLGNLSAVSKTEAGGQLDVTLPGTPGPSGHRHPITQTIDTICAIFAGLGFRVVEGPEIETERYNFEALNIPLDHPSRDAFDTFYLESAGGKHLLRSHTSPVQARFMEHNKPPFSIIVPGKVYRPDATDASHSFMFHQVEGLCVGSDIHFSDLKGALEIFAKEMFGPSIKMRLRPSFFPFTEPSAEVDISCIICGGNQDERRAPARRSIPSRSVECEGGANDSTRKCSVCGGRGWLEILGAGMVNPKVFKSVGYDPAKVTGFAFGMGVERIAMLKYGINDIRMFFENDVRFLRQF